MIVIDGTLEGSVLFFTTAEACDLLKKLEEVHFRSSNGAGEDYLLILSRILRRGQRECLQRMMTVRLALARYFSRCTMIGVGGKQTLGIRSNVRSA